MIGIGLLHYGGQKNTSLSASWRTRKAHGVNRTKSKGLRTESANVQGQEETSQVKLRANSPFFHLFCSSQALKGLVAPTHIGEGDLLYSIY